MKEAVGGVLVACLLRRTQKVRLGRCLAAALFTTSLSGLRFLSFKGKEAYTAWGVRLMVC